MELKACSLLLVTAISQLWCCSTGDAEYVTLVRRVGGAPAPAAATAGELEISLSSSRGSDSTNASLIRGEIVSQRRQHSNDNNIETRLDRIRARAASDSSRWRQRAERAHLERQRLAREMALLREQVQQASAKKNNDNDGRRGRRRKAATIHVRSNYNGVERLRRVITVLREKAPIVGAYSRSAGRNMEKRADRLERKLRKIEIRISRGRRRYNNYNPDNESALINATVHRRSAAAAPQLRILTKRSIDEAESSAQRELREAAAAAEQAEAWVKIITDAAAKEMELTGTNCTQEQSESVKKLLETVRNLQRLAGERQWFCL
ncbi:hypothetical protein TKK_0005297 [Trichogramma kaykai]|uniref:Uncharacterized protein n=1 Tax=Trichogramma kaykai TaxID=54128 RepID=A0ABD2XI29_9HYME